MAAGLGHVIRPEEKSKDVPRVTEKPHPAINFSWASFRCLGHAYDLLLHVWDKISRDCAPRSWDNLSLAGAFDSVAHTAWWFLALE